MSAASVVRYAAQQAEFNAITTGRRDQRIAAREMFKLADKLQRQADADRRRQAKRRGTPTDPQLDMSLDALRDTPKKETWAATKRTRKSFTLEKQS